MRQHAPPTTRPAATVRVHAAAAVHVVDITLRMPMPCLHDICRPLRCRDMMPRHMPPYCYSASLIVSMPYVTRFAAAAISIYAAAVTMPIYERYSAMLLRCYYAALLRH